MRKVSQEFKNSLGNVYETVYKVEIMRYNKLVKKLTKDIVP